MIGYQFYVDDIRFTVPTLYFVDASDDSRAAELAFRKMAESQHHLGVEVRRGDERILGIGSRRIEISVSEGISATAI